MHGNVYVGKKSERERERVRKEKLVLGTGDDGEFTGMSVFTSGYLHEHSEPLIWIKSIGVLIAMFIIKSLYTQLTRTLLSIIFSLAP